MHDDPFSESKTFRILHNISMDLARADTLGDLYRGIVERGLSDMGFDRIGLLLFDRKTSMVTGTWGTDEQGRLCDESYVARVLSPDSTFIWEALSQKLYVAVKEDKKLWHYTRQVGTGWNAMVAIWDHDEPIGWISVDNLIHGRPCTEQTRNAIAFYGNIAAHLILRKRYELELEDRVDRKTRELADKVALLEKTMARLVETEKLASLGKLVAGVAHEINTPLGNAILGLSYSAEVAAELHAAIDLENVSKSWVLGRLAEVSGAVETSASNLSRAAALVQRFKQLARDQHEDEPVQRLDIAKVVENVLASFQHHLRVHRLSVETDMDEGLVVSSYPGFLAQILGNFLTNTTVHGIRSPGDRESKAVIGISATGTGTWVLDYRDNGPGVPPEASDRIFEPFFTTSRAEGGTGLGLSIVHTLVCEKMGGTIEVYTPEGGGLGFRLEFPMGDHRF